MTEAEKKALALVNDVASRSWRTAMTDEAKALVERCKGHTPGPWRVDGPPHNQIVWNGPESRICFMAHSNGVDNERDIATGNLVAAAPELLDLVETQDREIERLREALEHIGIYGCGMLNQPAALNAPEEVWFKQRIFEMERTARAALAGDSHD